MWPPSGLLLAVLLLRSTNRAMAYVVPAAVASVAANFLVGAAFVTSIGFTIANMTESLIGIWLLRQQPGYRLSFVDPAGLWRFVGVACGIAALSATLATLLGPAANLSFFVSWFSTDLLGILIVTPMIVIGAELYPREARSDLGFNRTEVVAVLGGVAVVATITFSQSSYPLLFVPMATVILAVFRLGPFGATTGVLIIAVISSLAAGRETGPTVLIGGPPETRIFFVQFYLVTLLASSMPTAALLSIRRRLLRQLSESNRELDRARRVAEQNAEVATAIAETDQLTGLPNRRKVMQVLEQSIVSQHPGAKISIAIFDIDHFKSINDRFGHHVGDQVLKRVAKDATAALRQTDFIGRYGGEEFLLVLNETPVDRAMSVAERVRASIAEGSPAASGEPKTTVSIGVATYCHGETLELLVERADAALYQAKAAGRNALRLAA